MKKIIYTFVIGLSLLFVINTANAGTTLITYTNTAKTHFLNLTVLFSTDKAEYNKNEYVWPNISVSDVSVICVNGAITDQKLGYQRTDFKAGKPDTTQTFKVTNVSKRPDIYLDDAGQNVLIKGSTAYYLTAEKPDAIKMDNLYIYDNYLSGQYTTRNNSSGYNTYDPYSGSYGNNNPPDANCSSATDPQWGAVWECYGLLATNDIFLPYYGSIQKYTPYTFLADTGQNPVSSSGQFYSHSTWPYSFEIPNTSQAQPGNNVAQITITPVWAQVITQNDVSSDKEKLATNDSVFKKVLSFFGIKESFARMLMLEEPCAVIDDPGCYGGGGGGGSTPPPYTNPPPSACSTNKWWCDIVFAPTTVSTEFNIKSTNIAPSIQVR